MPAEPEDERSRSEEARDVGSVSGSVPDPFFFDASPEDRLKEWEGDSEPDDEVREDPAPG